MKQAHQVLLTASRLLGWSTSVQKGSPMTLPTEFYLILYSLLIYSTSY